MNQISQWKHWEDSIQQEIRGVGTNTIMKLSTWDDCLRPIIIINGAKDPSFFH